MAGILLSGPAGAGKTQQARQLMDNAATPMVAADFQSLYAALLLLERQPNGRYPERLESQAYVIPMVEYLRRVIMRIAAEREIEVVTTNSDGAGTRRRVLLDALGPSAAETVIDPGISVVRSRLAVNGVVSQQCETAIGRWYGRL